jgi:hypothetical protein
MTHIYMALTDQKHSQYEHAPHSILTLRGAVDTVTETCRILAMYFHPAETVSSNPYDTADSIQCVFITNRFSADISQTP